MLFFIQPLATRSHPVQDERVIAVSGGEELTPTIPLSQRYEEEAVEGRGRLFAIVVIMQSLLVIAIDFERHQH